MVGPAGKRPVPSLPCAGSRLNTEREAAVGFGGDGLTGVFFSSNILKLLSLPFDFVFFC